MSKRFLILLSLCIFSIGPVPSAFAQSADFMAHWDQGIDFFNLAKYEEAQAEFEQARDLDPKSVGPYQYLAKIAKVQERWPDCVSNAVMATALKPASKGAPETRKILDFCREKLGRPEYPGTIPDKQGGLGVITNVEGASVEVDGIKKGATPLGPFPLNPGKKKVKVERRGYLPKEVDVVVVETITVDVEVELAPDPNASMDDRINNPNPDDITVGWLIIATNVGAEASIAIDGKTPTPGPDGAYEQSPGSHKVEITAPGHEPWRRRVKVARGQKRTLVAKLKNTSERQSQRKVAYISFGVAAAFGATGAVFGFLENSAFEEAEDIFQTEEERPPPPSMGARDLVPVKTRADYEDARSRAEDYALISNVSLGVAAVALGVSIYYFMQERSPEREGYELPMALVPTTTPDGKGPAVVYTREFSW